MLSPHDAQFQFSLRIKVSLNVNSLSRLKPELLHSCEEQIESKRVNRCLLTALLMLSGTLDFFQLQKKPILNQPHRFNLRRRISHINASGFADPAVLGVVVPDRGGRCMTASCFND